MGSPCKHSLPLLFAILFVLLVFLGFFSGAETLSLTRDRPFNNSISAVFVFGDSTVDPGNNNYIGTPFQSNFPPYGRDFVDHIATGRFTNGRLVTDFIASYIGVKDYVPPYLNPNLSNEELMTGVSFASAGSGFDPLTSQITNVIPLTQQIENFREYRTRLEQAIGKEETKALINKAGFIVSAGTNDFVVTYFSTAFRQHTYTGSDYQQLLLQNAQHFIQGLLNEGAQLIGVVGLPPMGCLPQVITFYTEAFHQQRQCIKKLSSIARDYNQLLQKRLKAMQNNGTVIFYGDIYKPLNDMIQGQKSFGFDEVNKGCCGTGLFESSYLCNAESPSCMDASKYVFWDSIHPTEAAYFFLFQALRPTIDSVIGN